MVHKVSINMFIAELGIVSFFYIYTYSSLHHWESNWHGSILTEAEQQNNCRSYSKHP